MLNRIIKFRVWDKSQKQFRDDLTMGLFGTICSSNPEHYILSQFTGLNDKNGKEIYEGDIVAQFDFNDPYFRKQVIFHYGAFGYIRAEGGFIAYIDNYHFDWENGKSEKIEVIGNIFENPKLLRIFRLPDIQGDTHA